jgi:F420-non-reducing hydrogenase small subunit
MTAEKPKLAMYWASACGGCEISLIDIHEKILDVAAAFEPIFWPCIMDGKKKDVEALQDKDIALCFFNGAIRTDENEEMALLLRKKSAILVAYGSCAYEGCIPGLSNFSTVQDHFRAAYLENVSTDNKNKVTPKKETVMPEGILALPGFYDTVRSLGQIVDVDYFIPGCPPESHQVQAVVEAIISGTELPPKGSIIGAGIVALCEECPRKRDIKRIRRFFRPHEIIPEPETCLLEQGLICMGPATRSGCTALCPQNNMPCIGCYGPPPNVLDQGAKMLSAIASVMETSFEGKTEEQLDREINEIIDTIVDPAGTFYKFSLPHSLLGRAKPSNVRKEERK